jgi:hypothetical protein
MPRRTPKTTLPVIAFAGNGDSSEANTRKLLDDLPEELADIYVPERILRAQKGLKNVVSWLDEEVGIEGYKSVPRSEIIDRLSEAKGAEPILIFLPADPLDETDEKMILAAYDEGITVKNLAEGMDDLILDEPRDEPEPPPEEPAEEPEPRRRGKSRGSARSVQEEPDEAQAEVATEAASPAYDADRRHETARENLGTMGDVVYDLIVARLVSEGYVRKPRPGKPKLYPCWVDPDGNYRPRLGKGRGRKGEVTADLSEEDMMSIEGLAEDFIAQQ